MLPTFVIGLREGLEASLIVGIIAAFLVKQGRRDVRRWVFVGVGAGVLLCTGVGVLLRVISQNLPQRQQEGLESVIGAIAVLMVTYMVVWMKRHSRDLKGQLEGAATSALAVGSGFALVAMAFLAVMREGFETVVFLLAAFNESSSGSLAGLGALLGIVVAVALGYGIYRGGVRLNLSRFFRATGLVLVLVAGGLIVNALRTAHEAGWLNLGQQATLDLSAVVRPGSIQASLLTGMLGVQNHPALIEMVGWLVYVIPVGIYVAWPPGKAFARATLARVALVTGGVLGRRRCAARRARPDPAGDRSRNDRCAGAGPEPRRRPGDDSGVDRSWAREGLRRSADVGGEAWRPRDRCLPGDLVGVRHADTRHDVLGRAGAAQRRPAAVGSARGRRAGVDTDLGAADEPHHILDRAGNRTGSRHAVDADVYDDRPAADRSGRVGRCAYRGERLAGRSHHDRRGPGAKGPLSSRSAPSARQSRRRVRRRRCARPGHGARPAARQPAGSPARCRRPGIDA